MKTKYLHAFITATLICFALRFVEHNSAAGTKKSFASPEPAVSADAANETKIISKVTLSGPAPADPIINMATDPLCAKLHPKAAITEDIIVGAENALANVLVYVSEGLGNRTFEVPKQ